MNESKTCPICLVFFEKPKWKRTYNWALQIYCSKPCAFRGAHLKALAKPFRTCPRCARTLPSASFRFRNSSNQKFMSQCRECARVIAQIYYRENGTKTKAGVRTYLDPIKKRARSLIQSAVRRGKIQRQPCEKCGQKSQAHHHDYSKPYDVSWLCTVHHGMEHRKPVDPACLRALNPGEK